MKKARMLVLRTIVEKLITELHEAGFVEIKKTKYDGMEEGRVLPSFDNISAKLLRLRGLLSIIESNIPASLKPDTKVLSLDDAGKEMSKLDIDEKLKSLVSENSSILDNIKELDGKMQRVKRALHFGDVDFSKLTTKKLRYRLGEVQKITAINKLATVISKPGKSSNVILVLYDNKDEIEVDNSLNEAGFSAIELPQGTSTPNDTLKNLEAEINNNRSRMVQIKAGIETISKANFGEIKNLIASFEIASERSAIATKFASSKYLYVIECWLTEQEMPKLQDIVGKYGSEIMLEDVHFGHDEAPPIVLENPEIVSPFEFITKSYSAPGYFEFDPTIGYFIGLPIIYGMIVGDVIYGILSIFIALFFLKTFKNSYILRNVSKIWLYSAIPTIIFGVIFDEWGGMNHLHLLEFLGSWIGFAAPHLPLYEGFHRMENVMGLLGITALLGAVHLGAGFAIGAINEWNHNKKHSIAKIAWIGIELGGLFALGSLMGILGSAFMPAGLVLLVLSVIILAVTEGIFGVFEIPGLVGNILSYTRIASIGIVGVVLAEVINEFLRPVPAQGILALIIAPIFLLLHMANCFIAMFEAMIQGGRLNIIEFKSKFLHGGGKVFAPFGLKKAS